MSNGIINFRVNVPAFNQAIERLGAVSFRALGLVMEEEMMLLANELIQRTPPFAGRTVRKMLASKFQNDALARGGMGPHYRPVVFHDPEIETMSALAVGKKRVEKDVRRVLYGLKPSRSGANLSERHMRISRGNNPNATSWGTLQRCEGKQAVRVFATKQGQVYGADLSQWMPEASKADLARVHESQRGKRGRVTLAGSKTRTVGRWVWLNTLVTLEKNVAEYVKVRQGNVGQARGGWGVGYLAFGGKLSASGWVGKHAFGGRHGSFERTVSGGRAHFALINQSRWASAGDPDRVIESALNQRAQSITAKIGRILEKSWKGVL